MCLGNSFCSSKSLPPNPPAGTRPASPPMEKWTHQGRTSRGKSLENIWVMGINTY